MTNPAAAGSERHVARGAGRSGAAIFVSRVTGLLRDQVMAVFFGAGFATDAFNVAFRVPNLLRDLLAEGAMSRSFTPTFAAAQHDHGEEAAWELGRQLMLVLLLTLSGLVLVAWIFTPQIVRFLASGFAETSETLDGYSKLGLTALLTRVMLPFLPAVVLAAVAMSMLNARGRFAAAQIPPAVLNVSMVVVGVGLIPVARALGQPPMLAMAVGVLVGGLLQFLVQLPPLGRLGFRLRFERPRWHPGVRRIALMMVPATVSSAGAQVNVAVSTIIASHLQQGSVSWLYYAFRLQQLPVGVVGVSLGNVSLAASSHAMAQGDAAAFKRTLSSSLRLLVVLTVPAAAALIVLAQPVVAVLFEHGRFHGRDTVQTARAVVMYGLGAPGMAGVNVLTSAFYSLGAPWLAVQSSLVAIAVNLALNLLFVGPLAFLGLGHAGLALSSSVASTLNSVQLVLYMRRRVGTIEGGRILDTFLRAAAASAAAGVGCAALLWATHGAWHRGVAVEGLTVVAGGVLMTAGTWGAMRLLRVRELPELESLARSGLRRLTGR